MPRFASTERWRMYPPTHKAIWPRSFWLVSVLALTACSSTPPTPPPLTFALPTQFTHSAGASFASAERWWESLQDPQLNALVDLALTGNPSIAQSLARQRMAAAQARISQADLLPQVGLGAGSARQRQNMSSPLDGSTAPVVGTNHNLSLDVSWELDLWGRIASQAAAAGVDYQGSSEQLRAVRQSMAAQVVRMYLQIVHARAQHNLSQRTVETLTEVARQINNRVNVGIASPADGQLANANLGSARAGLYQRQEALEQLLRQLDVLLGQYPAGLVATTQTLPPVPAAPAAGVPAELLARRPDVRAAELGLLAAGYRLQAAQRSFLPSFSLSGSAGFSGAEFADLLSSGNFIWSIAGRLLQPIFQGGRLRAQIEATDAQRDEALFIYAETALNALTEVETALAIDGVLLQREQALQASATAAEEAMRVSYNRYQQGIDPFLNVLESQQRALDGRSAQISAHHARLENRLALHLALGGGFDDNSLNTALRTPSE